MVKRNVEKKGKKKGKSKDRYSLRRGNEEKVRGMKKNKLKKESGFDIIKKIIFKNNSN